MIGRWQQLRRASCWAALPANNHISCSYRLAAGSVRQQQAAAAAKRAGVHRPAPRPSLLCQTADTDVAQSQPSEEDDAMGGYTPADYITFSEDERWQCHHTAEVMVDAPADKCFELWHDWSKLVDFLDLVGQIGLDHNSPEMAMFQCFYRFRRLPVMELLFILERFQVEQNKSISFKSVYGMPLSGAVSFMEQADGQTQVRLYFTHPTPNLLVQLGIGPFGLETDFMRILPENLATFKSLAEAAAPPDWQQLKQQVAARVQLEEADEEDDGVVHPTPPTPPPPPQPRYTLSVEEAIALTGDAAAAEAGAEAGAEAAAGAAETGAEAAAAAAAAGTEAAAGAGATEEPAGRRPRTSRRSASAAPAAEAGTDGEAAAAAAPAAGGKRGRSRASTSRKTSTAAAVDDSSSSSGPAKRRSRSTTASTSNGNGQTDSSSSSSSSRGRRSTRRTTSAAGAE